MMEFSKFLLVAGVYKKVRRMPDLGFCSHDSQILILQNSGLARKSITFVGRLGCFGFDGRTCQTWNPASDRSFAFEGTPLDFIPIWISECMCHLNKIGVQNYTLD